MALTRPHRATNPAVAAIAAVGLLLAAACAAASPAGTNIDADLACTPQDLDGAYFMQTAGEVSVRNLADLSENAEKREAELESSGLRAGRFNYWKQAIGRPPFEDPVELVCQVMEFASEMRAARFVSGLDADPAGLSATVVAWFPAGSREAAELPVPITMNLPPGSRLFRLETRSPRDAHHTLYVAIAPAGRFVQSVYMGNRTGTATPGETTAVLSRLAARSQPAAFAR